MPSAYGLRPPASASCLGAALASCRPLPQQFLPVSATGSGRRCCTLGIVSGKFIFDIAKQPDLRVWLFCFFTGRTVAAGGICWRLFPSETAAQLGRNLSGALRQLPRRGAGIARQWPRELQTVPFCYIKHKNRFLYLIFAILRDVPPCR